MHHPQYINDNNHVGQLSACMQLSLGVVGSTCRKYLCETGRVKSLNFLIWYFSGAE